MPHFLLTFGDASRLVGIVIMMEAPSMLQARINAVVRGIARGVPCGDGYELSARLMTSVSPTQVGRMVSAVEATELIRRLDARTRPEK